MTLYMITGDKSNKKSNAPAQNFFFVKESLRRINVYSITNGIRKKEVYFESKANAKKIPVCSQNFSFSKLLIKKYTAATIKNVSTPSRYAVLKDHKKKVETARAKDDSTAVCFPNNFLFIKYTKIKTPTPDKAKGRRRAIIFSPKILKNICWIKNTRGGASWNERFPHHGTLPNHCMGAV